MGDDSMGVKQIDRLIEWLKANGHTAEEILSCIKYIANEPANPKQ